MVGTANVCDERPRASHTRGAPREVARLASGAAPAREEHHERDDGEHEKNRVDDYAAGYGDDQQKDCQGEQHRMPP